MSKLGCLRYGIRPRCSKTSRPNVPVVLLNIDNSCSVNKSITALLFAPYSKWKMQKFSCKINSSATVDNEKNNAKIKRGKKFDFAPGTIYSAELPELNERANGIKL